MSLYPPNTPRRPVPFVLISSNHGTMIVNRNDYRMVDAAQGYGVGYQLLTTSGFDQPEVDFVLALLARRRVHFGDGVVAVDCGANIGVHTIEWARQMHGWGEVVAFEAQEKIYYALAGNVAINNCLNVSARLAAVGARCGTIDIPAPDYLVPASYGSFELRQTARSEFIGQPIDVSTTRSVPMVSIDSLALSRLDFLKIDVEGMEEEVLAGADGTLQACHPLMLVEVIKSDAARIDAFLQARDYRCFPLGLNVLAVHASDPVLQALRMENNVLWLA